MTDHSSYEELKRRLQAAQSRIHELETEFGRGHCLQDALRESEERYRKLAEYSPVSIIVHAEEKLVYINAQAIRLLGGETSDQFLGRSVWDFVHPDFREIAGERVKRIYRKKSNAGLLEQKFLRLDGTVIDVEVMGNMVDYRGKPSSQVVFQDITEKKKLREQLDQVRKMEAIGTLAGGIAHDFNNILSAVVGFTEIALDDTRHQPAVQESLQEVLKAGLRAKDLVKQILTFSRQVKQEFRALRLGKLVTETMVLLRASIPTTIQIEQDIRSDSAIRADPTQMQQVIMNLVTNAAQAMQEAGGHLQVSLVNVWLDNEFTSAHPELKPDEYLKLSVKDTGEGMTPEVQERIFDPFFTTKELGDGVGMGLAVVHGIVNDHGGVVLVETAPGKGSTFDVFLPVLAEGVEAVEEYSRELPTGSERILFVDDEPVLTRLGKAKLERLGYRVTATTSSREALAMFRSRPQAFDLLITDLTMPEMTGDALTRAVHRIAPGFPVILCSGYTPQIPEARSRALDVSALVSKPIVIQELAWIIRKALAGAGKLQAGDAAG